jgi:hypothetical protein
MGPVIHKHAPEDEAFLRSIIFAEEDRYRYCSKSYNGGYRWFRNSNIIPIEHWRRPSPKRTDRKQRLQVTGKVNLVVSRRKHLQIQVFSLSNSV